MDAAAADETDSDAGVVVVDETQLRYQLTVRIPCADSRTAEWVKATLDVDKEISPDKVVRTLAVGPQGNMLIVSIQATEARLLRASVASLFDMMAVALRVLCEFDELGR